MAKTVAFDVEVESGNSVKTLGSLKEQLAQINEELEQVEIGSKAFTELSDQARSTASEIKTLEKTFEGLEPQQKTEAFLKGFEAISGAVAVTAGTLAIFGVESENVGKIEEKVQGAIAIAIGARAIAEGALQARVAARLVAEKAAVVATKAATVAQAAFNVVMNANPIFLLVTVLAAVTAGIYLFTQAIGDNTEEVEANNKQLLQRNQLLEDSANFQVRIAQATGRSAEEVKQAQIDATEATLARLEAEFKLAKAGEEQTKIAGEIRKGSR
jgi:archaellum component FlaC